MDTKPTETELPDETGAISIQGNGYRTFLSKEFVAIKAEALTAAKAITAIATEDEAEKARAVAVSLRTFRTKVAASHKIVKAPIIKAGREIDAFAKALIADTTPEEERVNNLLIGFTKEKEKERQKLAAEALAKQQAAEAAEAEARRVAEEAENARIKAQVAEATSKGGLDDLIAQAKALDEAAAAEEKLKSVVETGTELSALASAASYAAAPVARTFSTSKVIDYELEDIHALYKEHPELVNLTVKISELKWLLKSYKAKFGTLPEIPGIKVFERDKIN